MARGSNKIRVVVGTIAVGLILPLGLLLWWLAAATDDSAVIPTIAEVIDVLAHPFRDPPNLDSASLATGTIVSILRVLVGFAIAAILAVPLGVGIGRSTFLRDLTRPLVSFMTVVSPVAWLPLAIIAFGFASIGSVIYGDDSWRADILDQLALAVILVITTGAFFPIVLNASAGARNVRAAHVEAVRVLGGSGRQVFLKVVLPSSMPSIATGLRIGGGVAWRVMVAAEFFPGTRSGLGHMILTAQQQTEYQYAVAAIIVIAAMGLAIDGLFALIEHRVSRWRREER